MVTLQRALAFGAVLSCGAIVGNHLYVKDHWKSNHPLITESIELLLRDPSVVRELGKQIIKKGSSVSGILEKDKIWANINFEVEGSIKANVSLVADSKLASEAKPDEHLTEPYKDYSSTLMMAYNACIGNTQEVNEYRWKIASLIVTIDDWINIEVVNSTDKQHGVVIKRNKIVEESKSNESVGQVRRKKQMEKVAFTYWKMFFAGIFALTVGIYTSRLYTHKPIMNSILYNKSIEILKTNEVVRNKIGLPFHHFQALNGYMNYNRTKGNARFYIGGALGFAKVDFDGTYDKNTKEWKYDKFFIEKEGDRYEVKT